MNKIVLCVAAAALFAIPSTDAQAGFGWLSGGCNNGCNNCDNGCGGGGCGLFSCFKKKSCCQPTCCPTTCCETSCCHTEPTCCHSEPTCCHAAPSCCEAAPSCCGGSSYEGCGAGGCGIAPSHGHDSLEDSAPQPPADLGPQPTPVAPAAPPAAE